MYTKDSMLLESKVLPDRVYQKQEETLIVWTENESMDLALSFQAKADCNELWAKICDVSFLQLVFLEIRGCPLVYIVYTFCLTACICNISLMYT